MVPFRAAVEAGVAAVMTSHISFPALDPSGAAATFSAPILELLRSALGFSGLIASDALTMAGASSGRSLGRLACDAVQAGVDVLLDAPDAPAMALALSAQAERDAGFRDRLHQSVGRIEAASRSAPADAGDFEPASGSTMALADWLLAKPLARGDLPQLRAPLDLVVVDDDLGFKYPPSSSAGHVAETLRAAGLPLGSGGSRVVLVFAEPRAANGRARLGPESLERHRREAGADLVVVFGHPRLVEQIPAGPPVLLAWHRQRLMQEAAGRWLTRAVG
jgi:beta-glucosidase-like glycosyl hydrolase